MKGYLKMGSRVATILVLTLTAFLLMCPAFFWKAEAIQTEQPVTQCAAKLGFTQTDSIIALNSAEMNDKGLEVISTDGKDYQFKLELSDLNIKDADGKPLSTSTVIKITPAAASLTKGSLQILISIQRPTEIKPGVYTGSLMLLGDGKDAALCPVRKPIQLVVEDVPPLIDKATLYTYRLLPFTQSWWCSDCLVPLNNSVRVGKPVSLKPGSMLGSVKRDQGGFGVIYWTGETVLSESGIQELKLSIKDLNHAGKYDGTLKLNAVDDKSANVALTVNASDLILWPLVVIFLGITLALCVKRYINVKRTIWGLRQQEAELGVTFKQSQQRFADASQGRPYAAYSIADDLNIKRQELLHKIDQLQQSSGLAIDETGEAYKSVLADLKALEGHIAAWGGFASELKALQAALGVEDVSAPPFSLNAVPVLLASYNKLLSGESLTLEQFAQVRKDVSNATATVPLWFALKNKIERDMQKVEQLAASMDHMTDEQEAQLSEARKGLSTARGLLWQAGTGEELNNIGATGGVLESAESSYYQLAGEVNITDDHAGATVPLMTSLIMSSHYGALSQAFIPKHELLGVPADDTARERFYAEAIRHGDTLTAILAFLIAMLTGLNDKYFGQPFGTLKDYVGLFIWAVGTKLTLDAISAAFGWLYSRSAFLNTSKSA